MRKRIEKAMRRLMVLLAAICILKNMPYMALTAGSEETVSGNELNLEQAEEENEDQAQASNPESRTEDGEETEDTDTEDFGDGEEDTSDERDVGETEEPNKEEDRVTEEPEGTEALEKEPEDEADTEESIMLLSAEDEISTVAVQQPDGAYTDNNGVTYHYHRYDDRTANIYKLEGYSGSASQGKEIIIPMEIESYKITQLTFATEPSYFSAVTIPETVTYIGGSVFKFATIDRLYYNAVDATTDATNGSGGGLFCIWHHQGITHW